MPSNRLESSLPQPMLLEMAVLICCVPWTRSAAGRQYVWLTVRAQQHYQMGFCAGQVEPPQASGGQSCSTPSGQRSELEFSTMASEGTPDFPPAGNLFADNSANSASGERLPERECTWQSMGHAGPFICCTAQVLRRFADF